ncbi:MAG: UDP-glucose/GDP-mannose dehydrogenase family protein [Alphaproteobacteria bacterium]|nr:UDP-glucose/GDP-mannose dehydrogenase family protein [Alphaproteobacteria bacterium]
MKISVFGIGYVGAVTSACLADSGHNVVAVDVDPLKVDCLREGRSPIVETGLDALIQKNLKDGRLSATTECAQAVRETDMSLICVGTPSNADGSLDLKYIRSVCSEIGGFLAGKDDFHVVVVRSTVLPGTLENVVRPLLEKASGKRAGVDFGLGNNPEFLREGSAISDYYHPTQIVVGAQDARTAETILSLYEGIEAPRSICAVDVAEGVKYVSNSWRASKITFANETGNILKEHGVDSHKVMEIFFKDTKINMGPSFLTPGFAFGGSCLPKDVCAIRASANDLGVSTPFFDSLLIANGLQIERAFSMIQATGGQRIGLLGLSFKPETDDLRESPLVALAERLLKEGFSLRIYDPCVWQAGRMKGSNQAYLEQVIPQIAACLVETEEALVEDVDVLVIGNGTQEFGQIVARARDSISVVGLARFRGEPFEHRAGYRGICW